MSKAVNHHGITVLHALRKRLQPPIVPAKCGDPRWQPVRGSIKTVQHTRGTIVKIWEKERLLRSTILAGFAAVTMTGAVAYAQEAEDEDEDEQTRTEESAPAARGDTVVVTGSRIRRDSFTSTAPLQVIDAEQIRDAGLIDTAQILQQSNVAQGVQLDNTISTGGFVTDGGPAANNVSLRGLSADRTLVLINGRRFAPAGAEGAPSLPDVNLIPTTMIQRIDILLDGASSVYGSDAIAGVVNVILRDNFDGVQADAFLSIPETGAAVTQRYNLLMGSNGDNHNFLIGFEYLTQDRLNLNDSDYNFEPGRGIACYRNIWIDANGQEQSRCTGAIINRARRNNTTDMYRTPGTTNFPGILPVGWSTGDSSAPQNTSSYLEGEDDVIPYSQRYSLFATASRDLQPIFGFEGLQAFAELSHSNSQANQKQGFGGQLFPTVPATNPFNPFGLQTTPILAWPADRTYSIEVQQTRMIGGLRGDLAGFGIPEWEFEAFAGYTRSIGYSSRGGLDEDRLRHSLVTSRVEGGRIVCGGNTPTGFGFLDPDPCVPVNLFADSLYPIDGVSGTSFATQAELDYLFINRTVTTRVDQAIAGGFVTGPVFQLPAGPVATVLGVEWRRDSLNSGVDSVAAQGRAAGFFADRLSVGSVSLTEAYGEVSIPLLSGVTFAEDLSVDLAGRLTDHEFYGQNSTYSARVGYSPVDFLTLRGTYGTSFRAPNARELFLGGQTGFVAGTVDPCVVPLNARQPDPLNPLGAPIYDPANDTRSPQVLANCASEGVDPLTLGLGGSASIEALRNGNRGLDPETSTAWSLGFVLEQPWIDAFDFAVSVNWFKLEVEDSIGLPGAAFGLSQCYNSNDFPNDPFCARRVRDPASGLLRSVDNTPFNVSRSEVSGVDLNTRFGMDVDYFGGMRLDVNTQWTWSDEILNQTTAQSAVFDNVGDWGSPEWRGSITTRLRRGDWSAFWTARYVGAQASIYNDVTPGAAFPYGQRIHPNCSTLDPGCISTNNPATPFTDFSSYITAQPGTWYHSLSATYTQDTWIIRAGVNNILGEDPAVVSGQASGATLGNGNAVLGSGYDLIGRSFFVNVSKQF
jgi:iron complex outermembrane recepter protein